MTDIQTILERPLRGDEITLMLKLGCRFLHRPNGDMFISRNFWNETTETTRKAIIAVLSTLREGSTNE
jgi:hypothetical protein